MKPAKAMMIRLSADQAELLETVANVDNRPISDVIRAAVDGHIAERKQDAAFQKGLRARIEHARQMLND